MVVHLFFLFFPSNLTFKKKKSIFSFWFASSGTIHFPVHCHVQGGNPQTEEQCQSRPMETFAPAPWGTTWRNWTSLLWTYFQVACQGRSRKLNFMSCWKNVGGQLMEMPYPSLPVDLEPHSRAPQRQGLCSCLVFLWLHGLVLSPSETSCFVWSWQPAHNLLVPLFLKQLGQVEVSFASL